MLRFSALLLVGIVAANVAHADRKVHFTGDFESGELQKYGNKQDGFFLKTLPHPQGTADQLVISSGGAGPDSNLDTRVVPSERVGTELVTPRRGDYFVRSALYFDKKYDGFLGNSSKNKPRMSMILKKESDKFDYDVEGYTGFSIYLPQNLEDETGRKGYQGKNMLMNISAPGAAEFFTLSYWVPEKKNEAHWFIRLNHSTRSTDRDGTENIDLGPVAGDKGRWTDFVIRWRSNPFSVDTNPAKAGIPQGKDKLYQGNKGIFQLWKGEGAADSQGNRRMVLKVNKVNTPVGLVPHKDWTLGHSFRQYKHGWHQQPTSVKGPVWIGFDEIRFGLVDRDGTDYSDVHPMQVACSESCSNGSGGGGTVGSGDVAPNPPQELTVVQE